MNRGQKRSRWDANRKRSIVRLCLRTSCPPLTTLPPRELDYAAAVLHSRHAAGCYASRGQVRPRSPPDSAKTHRPGESGARESKSMKSHPCPQFWQPRGWSHIFRPKKELGNCRKNKARTSWSPRKPNRTLPRRWCAPLREIGPWASIWIAAPQLAPVGSRKPPAQAPNVDLALRAVPAKNRLLSFRSVIL